MAASRSSASDNPREVLCIGETMVLLTPSDGHPLDATQKLAISIGGAESNVALYLSDLGAKSQWLSQVGDDPFGRRIISMLDEHGVSTAHVAEIDDASTAVYFKDPGRDGTRVHYYRKNSAASLLSPANLARIDLTQFALVHMSGITPALSASCAALTEYTARRCRELGVPFSFDINFRPGLWSAREAARALREFAELSSLVFVGRDEAEVLWHTSTPADIAALLDLEGMLVVKDGAIGATEFAHGRETFVPAPVVDVVEPVGAGDAFAAGYLSAFLDPSATSKQRLARGHELAGRALRSIHDFEPARTHDRKQQA